MARWISQTKAWSAVGAPDGPVRAKLAYHDALVVTDDAPGCSVTLPTWDGQSFGGTTMRADVDCRAADHEIGGITAAGNTIVLGYKNSGRLAFVTGEGGAFSPFEGGPPSTYTGLAKAANVTAWEGQLFIGGQYDPVKRNYLGGSEIASGKSVRPIFRPTLRSAAKWRQTLIVTQLRLRIPKRSRAEPTRG